MPRLAEVVIVLPKQSDKGEERRDRDAAQPALLSSRAAGRRGSFSYPEFRRPPSTGWRRPIVPISKACSALVSGASAQPARCSVKNLPIHRIAQKRVHLPDPMSGTEHHLHVYFSDAARNVGTGVPIRGRPPQSKSPHCLLSVGSRYLRFESGNLPSNWASSEGIANIIAAKPRAPRAVLIQNIAMGIAPRIRPSRVFSAPHGCSRVILITVPALGQ